MGLTILKAKSWWKADASTVGDQESMLFRESGTPIVSSERRRQKGQQEVMRLNQGTSRGPPKKDKHYVAAWRLVTTSISMERQATAGLVREAVAIYQQDAPKRSFVSACRDR